MNLTEMINKRISGAAPMSREQILAELIEENQNSDALKMALTADRYHHKKQDIKEVDFQRAFFLNEDDNQDVFFNPNRSNLRIQHRFLRLLVEQKISYVAGKEPTINVDDAEEGNDQQDFQDELTSYTDASFNKILQQWLRKASLHGVAYLHEYKDKKGILRHVVLGRDNFIPIYETEFDQELKEGIYYYKVTVREGKYQKVITKAQWWTDENVTFFVGTDNKFSLDREYAVNPAPHFWQVTRATDTAGKLIEKKRTAMSWGRLPFIEIANNDDKISDLDPVKDLIDAYDLIASKGSNNLMDFNEFYAVIQGFGGDTASAIVKKLEINRAVSVNSQGGNIEMKQHDLQMLGRIDWLKELWKAIFVFGQGVDVTNDVFGNSPSGVSLKYQYTLLDQKARNMIIEASPALIEHLAFLTDEINRLQNKKYDPESIHVVFNRSQMANDKELAEIISDAIDIVPDKILVAAHPLVHDPDQAYKDLIEQREERKKEQKNAFGEMPDISEKKEE